MAPEAKAADHVYRQLKHDVMHGRFPPTAILNVRQIATEIGVSISPVRDAMERLAGERLVIVRAGGGFQAPATDEVTLRDLYHWHGHLARWATLGSQGIPLPCSLSSGNVEDRWRSDEAIVEATFAFFLAVASAAGSAEHSQALRSAGERLFAFRLWEGQLIQNRSDELLRLIELAAPGRTLKLRNAISTYHRRRIRVAPALVALLSGPRRI
jgi:DNA-binding transcriptional MocR family regulator